MAYNILAVDDSATVRAVLAKTLRLGQVPVNEFHEAANGREALKILEDNYVDIVFADINMPVMGGVDMIKAMQRDGLLSSVPVVLVTTEGNSDRIESLLSLGVEAYVRKPFAPETIRGVIDDILGDADES